jgi:hypothetical protein
MVAKGVRKLIKTTGRSWKVVQGSAWSLFSLFRVFSSFFPKLMESISADLRFSMKRGGGTIARAP